MATVNIWRKIPKWLYFVMFYGGLAGFIWLAGYIAVVFALAYGWSR